MTFEQRQTIRHRDEQGKKKAPLFIYVSRAKLPLRNFQGFVDFIFFFSLFCS